MKLLFAIGAVLVFVGFAAFLSMASGLVPVGPCANTVEGTVLLLDLLGFGLGGPCLIAAGLWALWRYFRARKTPSADLKLS